MRDQAYDEERLLHDDITTCYAYDKRGDWLFMVTDLKEYFFGSNTLLDPHAGKVDKAPLLYEYYRFLTRPGVYICGGGYQ
jgi:hypothetical protein